MSEMEPRSAAPTLSCCVFAWDELATLRPVVLEQLAELRRLGVTHELVIIDDGSTDGTSQEADRLASEEPGVRVIHHDTNRGLGGVYRTGFSQVHGEYLTFFPADGQFPATILAQYMPLMTDADVVLGWVEQRNEPFLARLLSRCERLLYALLFGPFPRFRGIMMLRRTLLDRLPLVSDGRGWVVVMELLIKATRSGARIRDGVPNPLRLRSSGASKVRNLPTIVANLVQVFELRRRL